MNKYRDINGSIDITMMVVSSGVGDAEATEAMASPLF